VTSSDTLPILTGTSANQGTDTPPGDIVVRSCTTAGTRITLGLQGEIDHFSATPLRVMLAAAAARGYNDLVLIASRITFCDSSLLRVLESWARRGGRARVLAPSRAGRRLLQVTASHRWAHPGWPEHPAVGDPPPAGASRRVRSTGHPVSAW
jgi:anti-anti-sigma factor